MSLEPSSVDLSPVMEQAKAKLAELLNRQGLLKTPTQTLEVELALAAVGRELADSVMELLLVASVEANAAATRRGASPPWGEEDAVHGATYNARVALRRAMDLDSHHLPSSSFHPAPGAAQGKRPSRQGRGR